MPTGEEIIYKTFFHNIATYPSVFLVIIFRDKIVNVSIKLPFRASVKES